MIQRFWFFVLSIVLAAPAAAQVPNYRQHVQACIDRYPAAWGCLNEARACKLDFIILCARDIHGFDMAVGLNGKRGDPRNLSADILDFKGLGTTVDVIHGGALAIVDIAFASDDPARRRVDWNQHDIGPGTWVDPFSVDPSTGGALQPPTPQPPAADPIGRALQQIDQMHGWLKEIITFVRALQGQQ